MFNSNKNKVDNEELKEFQARRKAIRKEDSKDCFADVAMSIAPVALFFGGVMIAGSIACKKAEKKDNFKNDILAQAYGFKDRNDLGYVKMKHDEEIAKYNFENSDDDESEEE